jgi:hypothetical protein
MNKNVLLIEDNLELQNLISSFLKSYDYDCIVFSEPLEALKDFEGNVYYEQIYKDSLIHIEKYWNENGNLICQVDNDITKVWFSNGQLCSENQFSEKKLIDQKCWYSDGRSYSETELNSNFCTSDLDNDKVCDCDDYCPEFPGEPYNNGCPVNPIKGVFNPANCPSGENVLNEFLASNIIFPNVNYYSLAQK